MVVGAITRKSGIGNTNVAWDTDFRANRICGQAHRRRASVGRSRMTIGPNILDHRMGAVVVGRLRFSFCFVSRRYRE